MNKKLIDGDYTLSQGRAWFTVGGLSVRLAEEQEQIRISVYPLEDENCAPLGELLVDRPAPEANLYLVVMALVDAVTYVTWNPIGTYVRATFPAEFQCAYLRGVVTRVTHGTLDRAVLQTKLYREWLNDTLIVDTLLGR